MRAPFLALAAGAVALAAAAVQPAPAAAQTTIRVASFTPEGAVGVRFVMKPWMEAVQAELGNKVNLVPFWGGALGPNPFDQFDLVRDGVVDVAWVLPGYTPGQFPQIGVTELPFTVASGEEGSVVGWRLYEAGLLDGLDDVHVLTVWTPDITNIHLTAPVRSLADLRGKSLRTAGSTQAMFVEAIGAAPQTLGSVEANEAMQRRTIDGQLQGWTGMNTFGGFAVAKASYRVPLGASPFFMLMNKRLWDSLPADVQAVMMKHGGEQLARAGGRAYDRLTQEIIARQQANGYTIVDAGDADVARYREQHAGIYEQWARATPKGRETIDAFFRLIDQYRAGN
jgi:TRAP-type C4-dicarboxylate transport system substrate-binding protein